jgi:YD repeat-containing protein
MSLVVRSLVGCGVVLGLVGPLVGPKAARPQGSHPIKQQSVDSLFTMKLTTATAVQDALPILAQRGVQLDGAVRAAPSQGMLVAANPFELEWRAPSVGGINLATGGFELEEVDIALPAAVPWTIGRSYNARQESGGSHRNGQGHQGRNWHQTSQPEIAFYDDASDSKDMIFLVYGAGRFSEYKRVDSTGPTFRGVNGASGVFKLTTDAGSGPDTYTLTDQNGHELVFFAFDADSGVAKGQLWKITDPAGNSSYVGDSASAATAITAGFDSGGRILNAYDSAGRRYTYTYTYTTLDSVVRLTEVEAETKTGGTWASPTGLATVMTVAYGYYSSETYGDPGDLKTVTLTTPLTDSGVSLTQKKYYRYWEGTFDATTNPGHPHALQYVVDYEGVRRFDWADSTFDDDHLTASETSLKPYATAYFKYDSSHRVKEAWFNGDCGCSGANNGTYAFEYETNGSFSDTANTYDSGWKTRTVVERPDTSYLTQYWDEVWQPLSQVITDADPDNSPAPNRWVTRVERDSTGSVSKIATPANCTGYTHSTGAITASTSAGLIWEYTRAGAGAMTGFVTAKKYRVGTSGTLYFESEVEYAQNDLDIIATGNPGAVYVTRPAIDDTTRYPQVTSTASSTYEHPRTVSYDGTDKLSVVSVQETQPAISTGNNGSGSALSATQYYTVDGRPSYTKARDGILGYQAWTNGLVTTSIEDADTSLLTDEPAGLSSTGTPFHRVTTYAYDAQGRLELTTHPDGRKIKHYYSKLADGRFVQLEYADYETTPKFHGPVSYRVTNQAGEVEAEATVGLTSNESTTALTGHVDESSSDPIAAMDLASSCASRPATTTSPGTRSRSRGSTSIFPPPAPARTAPTTTRPSSPTTTTAGGCG